LASKTLGELNLLFHDLPRTAQPRTPRAQHPSPTVPFDAAWWRFRFHLAAFVLASAAFVQSSNFSYWEGLDAEWPLIPFLGWGAAVAWHGLTASHQRRIARPKG
jgi:hypothetical protein